VATLPTQGYDVSFSNPRRLPPARPHEHTARQPLDMKAPREDQFLERLPPPHLWRSRTRLFLKEVVAEARIAAASDEPSAPFDCLDARLVPALPAAPAAMTSLSLPTDLDRGSLRRSNQCLQHVCPRHPSKPQPPMPHGGVLALRRRSP
jgi:hypothetical protein